MVQLSSQLFALSTLFPGALSLTRNYVFNVTNTDVSPDGFPRSAVTVNGQFPGPVVTANGGDSLSIVTSNQLANPNMRRSTSIHWHGIFQHRTAAMDGPSFVNQCPIPPNATFTYAFSTANQTGSYWYHSHLSTQYCDGLRGAMVVYDPKDPLAHLYDVDDASTLITLADWYHDLAIHAGKAYFETGMVPLINGVGRYVGGPSVPYAVINIVQGKRYRFRIFAISCLPFYTFSIDKHTFDVMELDGTEHNPVPAQNVDLFAGQRVSIIVNANQTVGNYWIRAPATTGIEPDGNPNYDPSLTLAILRYKGAPSVEPTTIDMPGVKLNDADMHPIAQANPGAPGGSAPADVAINLQISMTNPPFYEINGISYESPSVPVLLQLLSGAAKPQQLLPSQQTFIIPANKVIEISIPGGHEHPFHLHGHNIDIVRESNSDVFNYVNPPRRDVVSLLGGNTTFRFFSGNAGAWFLHCHIDWHLEVGLAVVFAEAPEENVSGPDSQIAPQSWIDLCPMYDNLDPEFQ